MISSLKISNFLSIKTSPKYAKKRMWSGNTQAKLYLYLLVGNIRCQITGLNGVLFGFKSTKTRPTLSINHNWANSTCLNSMFNALKEEYKRTGIAIEDLAQGIPRKGFLELVDRIVLQNYGWVRDCRSIWPCC